MFNFNIPSPPAMRELNPTECVTGENVFNATIDYTTVRVADDTGLDDKPWCSPPGWGGYLYFVLHVGQDRYANGIPKGLLVHELTHVWQGQHNIPLWYVVNSGCYQAFSYLTTGSTSGAYAYPEDLQWSEYNAEQQASIVAGWYASGMSIGDWRFRYIRSNILTGDPFAQSQPVRTFQMMTARIIHRSF